MNGEITLHKFHGGIHPPENKTQSTQTPIYKVSLPQTLVVPVRQHIGEPAEPCVQVGENVLKGQVIATARLPRSLPVHAPTSGVVSAIEMRPIAHASGLMELCLEIQSDGQDKWVEHQGLLTELSQEAIASLEPASIVAQVQQAGIAGLGGAGFPTYLKLASKQRIETLIINAAECEPYITADDMLMRERPDEVILGIAIIMQASGADRCLIGIEDNKPEATLQLEHSIKKLGYQQQIQVVVIPTLYPSGGEKQLIKILTGQEVPSAGIPAQLGILCQNVGTAAAVYEAVYLGKPLISRITTVTGEAIRSSGNYEVLIGTPVLHLLNEAGYQAQAQERVINGGPLMGFALPELDVPIIKSMNCLLAPSEPELPFNDLAMACIRCGQCSNVCPQELLPQQLYWFAKGEEYDKAEQHNLFDCIECGACSYVCPSHIPLVQYYRHAKGSIRAERAAHAKSEIARQRFEQRNERHARLEAEKEAMRKARAEAAALAKAQQETEEAAKAVETPTPSAANEQIENLERKVLAQADRIKKMQERLDMAKQENLDTVATLQSALDKQLEKLAALESELKAAQEA